MTEVSRIVDQMKRACEGGAWHGPSLVEVLAGVDARSAASRPVGHAHSVWEIVLHLIGTQELLLSRLDGDDRELTPEEDWPEPPRPTATAWESAKTTLVANDETLRARVSALPDDRLDQPLVGGGSSVYVNFHGYVQHNLYHAGQIAILKKSAGA